MPRTTKAEIEHLKRAVKLRGLLESSGVELARHGKQLAGRCPWHGSGRERTPSLIVSPDKNLWNCMAGCGGGSPIDFVMKRDGVSFVQAVDVLRGMTSSEVEPSAAPTRAKRSSAAGVAPARRERTPEERAVLEQVTTHFTHVLKETPRALSYMERRGLVHPELIDRFRLGFSNETLRKTLPSRETEEGRRVLRILEELGLSNHGHETFVGSLICPILDEEGRVLGLYGRRIAPPARGTSPHRYLSGPHRGVFNVQALKASEEVIICESIIDALTCVVVEQPAIAAYGVDGFGPDHFAALTRYGTKRALIAYDADAAGDRGASELAEKLTARGVACYRVELPRKMDVNEYAQKLKPAAKSLGLVLRKATPMLGAPARPISMPAMGLERETEAGEPIRAVEAERRDEAPVPSVESEDAPPVPSPFFAAKTELAAAAPSPPPERASALPQSISPSAPASSPLLLPVRDVLVEERGEDLYLTIEDRRYRVRGLAKNTSMGSLKVNLLATRGEQFFMDSLDLCLLRARQQFERLAALDLAVSEEVMHKDLGKVLRKLEELQGERIAAMLDPKDEVPEMTAEQREAAMALLKSPDLFERIEQDLERMGLVGEVTNKLLAYVASVSRKMDDPIAVMIQSSSAAGKTRLQDTIYECAPTEERVRLSAMTGQALYYVGETELCHKLLVVSEEEGAERASYPLKLLASEHELVIAATMKTAQGDLQTKRRTVRGPTAIFLTTTALEVDEELMNRAFVLTVDEGQAQTQAIHRLQRKSETLEGLLARRQKQRLVTLHQNAQRLLRPIPVLNNEAESLSFPDRVTRARRDNRKYLTLIRAIAFVRQHQKVTKTIEDEVGEVIEYIEADRADIELANRWVGELLSRTVSELPPQTERLLGLIVRYVSAEAAKRGVSASEVRFTRREIREATGFGNTQLKTHFKRLEDLEHIALRRGYRFEYELVGDPSSAPTETPKRSGREATWSGSGPNMVGAETAESRGRSAPPRPSFFEGKAQDYPGDEPGWSGLDEKHLKGLGRNGAVNGATNGAHAPTVRKT